MAAERRRRLEVRDLRHGYLSGRTDDANGFEVALFIQSDGTHVVAVRSENGVLHHGLGPGVAFLQKPIRPETQLEKSRSVLRCCRMPGEQARERRATNGGRETAAWRGRSRAGGQALCRLHLQVGARGQGRRRLSCSIRPGRWVGSEPPIPEMNKSFFGARRSPASRRLRFMASPWLDPACPERVRAWPPSGRSWRELRG